MPDDQKAILALGEMLSQLFRPTSAVGSDKLVKVMMAPGAIAKGVSLPNGEMIILTDQAFDEFQKIVELVFGLDPFSGKADYADYWTAIKSEVAARWLPMNVPSALQFLENIQSRLQKLVGRQCVVASLEGVVLDGINELKLGTLTLTRASLDLLDAQGVDYSWMKPEDIRNQMGKATWLVGIVAGTPNSIATRFSVIANLAAGLLAVFAGATHEGGIERFRISAVTSTDARSSRSTWLSWSLESKGLNVHHSLGGGQQLKLGPDLLAHYHEIDFLALTASILHSKPKNSFEGSILKAVYWFGEAHRDPAPVMRFLKYWSVIECFFTPTRNEIAVPGGTKVSITKAVSVGMAGALLEGPYPFIEMSDYVSVKNRVSQLYNLRSKAVHEGLYDHIPLRDLVTISTWCAWLIIQMTGFLTSGHKDIASVLTQCLALDEAASKPAAST